MSTAMPRGGKTIATTKYRLVLREPAGVQNGGVFRISKHREWALPDPTIRRAQNGCRICFVGKR